VCRNGSSDVDNVNFTQNIFPFVNHFEVHEPNLLSDHCVVDFAKDVICTETNTDDCDQNFNVKYVWNKDYVQLSD